MTHGARELTLLTRASAAIFAAADAAANDAGDDRVCCWGTQRIAHQESVIETRIDADGHDDHQVIAVPVCGRVAEHIALWGPNTARTVAGWLDAVAAHHVRKGPLRHSVEGPECSRCAEAGGTCEQLSHALAVAREILGTKHEDLRAATDEHAARAANSGLVR